MYPVEMYVQVRRAAWWRGGAFGKPPGCSACSGEHRDDFQHILGQLFLETRLLALVDDHDLNALQFAQRKYQLGAKAHQTVLMILCISKGQREPARYHRRVVILCDTRISGGE